MNKRKLNIDFNIRAALIFLVMAAFVVSGIFCCCFTSKARSGVMSVRKESAHCHQDKSDHAQKSQSKTCDCFKLTVENSTQIVKIIDNAGIILKALAFFNVDGDLHFSRRQMVSSPRAYQGPPVMFGSLAIYLQYSSLRI